jgi:hypothetical protein
MSSINRQDPGDDDSRFVGDRTDSGDRYSVARLRRVVTIQDGWTLTADGLHIHRWYLHVEPLRWDRLDALYEAHPDRPRIAAALAGRPLEEIARVVGPTPTEHLLRRPWTADSERAFRDFRTPEQPLVVAEAACEPEGRSFVVPAEVIARPELQWSFPPGFQEEAAAWLASAELGYLARLAGGVVVHVDRRPDPVGDVPDEEPLTTLLVQWDEHPVRYAGRLAVAAGAEVLRLFIETGTMYVNAPEGQPRDARPPTRYVDLDGAGRVPAAGIAVEIFSACVALRYWSRLARSSHGDTVDTVVAAELEAAENDVRRYADVVYPVGEAFGCIDTFDLINAFYPGPRQFAKNRIGVGPGQGH